MNSILDQMLSKYENKNIYDKKNSMKEVIQEIVLCGLSRAGFFKDAAFYGGTALRIFYDLDRFSEDLDFSLKKPDSNYNFGDFLPMLEKEVSSYGLNLKAEEKAKTTDSAVKSAFLKGNTKEHLLLFFNDSNKEVAANEVVKIKFEVDTNPPAFATYETKYRLLPVPYQVAMYDMPSLFSGKLHAVICRNWKKRIKGRDLYDYVFYLSRGTGFNLKHLQARLEQTGHWDKNSVLTLQDVKNMLIARFEEIDYVQARKDVLPFIKNTEILDLWSKEFFCAITDSIQCR